MIQVKINKAGWEYDIHSLVKAFYPEETVKVLTPESVEKKPAEEPLQTFTITVEEKQITMKPEDGTLWTLNTADIERTAPAFKNEFKKFLYRSLSAYTGKKLPWGNLTGIRPTKIAMTMLEEGKEEAEVAAFFKQEHYVRVSVKYRRSEVLPSAPAHTDRLPDPQDLQKQLLYFLLHISNNSLSGTCPA